ncbi:MAG: outer membrane protein assembly factor BamD, partial [Flavobacteriales bacterium]|nr:outer membrane protein assembly factor BamD [Flavobacteriales bacterium]
YQTILKSSDLEFKYEQAIKFYEDEEYVKAFPLFDELLLLHRGTDKAETIYYYYSKTEYKKGNLLSAAYHFKNFASTYKNNPHTEECAYFAVYCHYLLSPKYSLDQANTYKALEEVKVFLDIYPNSAYTKECIELQSKLQLKLQHKSFENAKLYYTTENYKSAIHAFNLALQESQNSIFNEEILFLQLKSFYLLAENSVEHKKEKRIKDTVIAFNQFKNAYPKSEWMQESKRIFKQVKLLRK